MTKDHEQHLRQNLAYLISGGGAHAKFDDVIKNLPLELRGRKPENFPHSSWMILEHMRIAQWDILGFSRNKKYVSPKWPDEYWPKAETPPNAAAWNKSIQQFRADQQAMIDLVENPKADLFRQNSLGGRADDLAGSAASGRSQCVSLGTNRRCAADARGMEGLSGLATCSGSEARRRSASAGQPKGVQFHDMVYILFRYILYTFRGGTQSASQRATAVARWLARSSSRITVRQW